MSTRGPVRRVFLSSTLRDLEPYRDAAKRTVAKFQKIYEDFTEWTPQSGSPLQASLKLVESCDLLVVLVAHRYGERLDELGGKSITHAEVELALSRGIPVRAFFVKDDHAWQVKDVDADQGAVAAFKDYVKKFCTPSYFGSPESLEIELSRCLLETLIAEGLKPEAGLASLVRSRPIEELSPFSEGVYLVGNAPDGVQLALKVRTSERKILEFKAKVSKLVGHCQMKNGEETISAIVDAAREVARARATRHWQTLPLPVDGKGIGRTFLIRADYALTQLFRSILDSCLGEAEDLSRSRIIRPVRGGQSSRQVPERMSAQFSDDDEEDRRLAIGVDPRGDRHVLVGHKNLWRRRRRYIEESLTSLPRVTFLVRLEPWRFDKKKLLVAICEELAKHGCRFEVGGIAHGVDELRAHYLSEHVAERYERRGIHAAFDSAETYRRLLADPELRALTDAAEHYVKIPLASLVDLVAQAAEKLATAGGTVHGNVKPSNIFTTEAGIEVVDGYDVPVGEPSPFFSDEWASPEQAMGEGLDEATDVYSLCRILCVLLRLHTSGELVTYRVSAGGSEERDFQFVRHPYIHYKPNPEVARFSDRHKLNDVLEKGLAGIRSERTGTLDALVTALREIDFTRLEGVRRLSLKTPPLGNRQLRLENGRYVPYRFVEEEIELDPEFEDDSDRVPHSTVVPSFVERRRR